MPAVLNQAALPVVVVLVFFLVGWYVVGNEVMRRRARRPAVWCERAADPARARQSIR